MKREGGRVMKRLIRLCAALSAVMLFGCCFTFAGCGMNVEDLKCATSETTDYIAVVKDQAVYGDKVLSIDECVNSYISERSDGNGSSYRHSYYDGPYMYTIVERNALVGDRSTYDFIRLDLREGSVSVILANCPSLDILFFYQNYIFICKGKGNSNSYSFINLSDFFEIEVSDKYFLNQNGNLYRKSESDTGITITTAKIADEGDRVETTGEYTVLYKGYKNYRLFRVYDDCVVTDKFIYKIAADEYNYCLFKHDYLCGSYYTRIHYIVSEEKGIISTKAERSYVYLKNADFVDKTQNDLEKDRVLLGPEILGSSSKPDIRIQYIGFSETIPSKTLKKNKYIAALMKKSANFQTAGLVGDNVVLTGVFSDDSFRNESKSTYYYSTLLVNIITRKVTFLGTVLVPSYYGIYYDATVLEVNGYEA